MVKKLDKDRSCFESGAFLNWGQGCDVILANGCSDFLWHFNKAIHGASLILDLKRLITCWRQYMQLFKSLKNLGRRQL